jgi:hypothetical protein
MPDDPQPYGRIWTPLMLEDDVLRLLAPDSIIDDGLNWLAHLVYEAERQSGLTPGELPVPVSWNTVSAADDWPIGSLPAVLIMAGASDGEPNREFDGTYTEAVRLEVAIVDSARTLFDARRNAGIYATAARAALSQQLGENNSSGVLGIIAGQFDPRPLPVRDAARKDTVAAGLVACHVVIGNTLTDTVSIRQPPTNPGDPIPTDPDVAVGGTGFDVGQFPLT